MTRQPKRLDTQFVATGTKGRSLTTPTVSGSMSMRSVPLHCILPVLGHPLSLSGKKNSMSMYTA